MRASRLLVLSLSISLAATLAFGEKKGKAGDPAKGKEVFEQCAVCHNADSDAKKTGPGLKGLFAKAKLKNGKKPTEETIRAVVDTGGHGMPAFKEMLSDEEKADLIAYLKTL